MLKKRLDKPNPIRAGGLSIRVKPTVDMNPVLLKPLSEVGAQVVVHGQAIGNARAREFQGSSRNSSPPCSRATRESA